MENYFYIPSVRNYQMMVETVKTCHAQCLIHLGLYQLIHRPSSSIKATKNAKYVIHKLVKRPQLPNLSNHFASHPPPNLILRATGTPRAVRQIP